jgi:16S rRNA (cytosine967-C5)-methyltransferase
MTARQKTARAIAAETLDKFFSAGKPYRLDEILYKTIDETKQRQKATDLVFGCIRNCTAIDSVISKFGNCPVERIQQKIINIIRVAAYELIYCPSTVEYAVVNEAVELAKSKTGKKQTAFANAVLRQITRHIRERTTKLSKAEPTETLPQTIETGCQFDTEILPEPDHNPDEYLSMAFSLPKWLIKVWLKDFGLEKTRQICFASNRRPGVYLRPNLLKTTTKKLFSKLQNSGIDAETTPDGEMLRLKSPAEITRLPGFSEGLFVVQDPPQPSPYSF